MNDVLFKEDGRRLNMAPTPSRIPMDCDNTPSFHFSYSGGANCFIRLMILSFFVTVPSKSQNIMGCFNLPSPLSIHCPTVNHFLSSILLKNPYLPHIENLKNLFNKKRFLKNNFLSIQHFCCKN